VRTSSEFAIPVSTRGTAASMVPSSRLPRLSTAIDG
jgi:hypothetical protein